jgi:UDP-N-acetylmuramoyl-tripeptide--D-alanyl-D-alanine ligase
MLMASIKKIFHDTRRQIAKVWLKIHPQVKIIGITGSYGKTNTAQVVNLALTPTFETVITDINLDTTYNLPITLLKIRRRTQMAILEYCIDYKGEMDQHLELVRPDIAIITGITPVHTEKEMLGSLEGIIQEKGKLLAVLPRDGWAILNFDNPWVAQMAQKSPCPVISYGSSKKFDFYFDQVEIDKKGTSFVAHFKENDRMTSFSVHWPMLGEHFAQEALAAFAVGSILGIKGKTISQRLTKIKPLPGRMSLEKGPQKSWLINDSLRANPASTIAGLKTLAAIKHQGKKIAVLGEMGELGQYKKAEHYQIGQLISQLGNIDYLITLGPATKEIIRGAIDNGFPATKTFYASSHQEAANKLNDRLDNQTLWYLKGSLLKHLERILLDLGGQKVACQKISCHNYYHCQQCNQRNS